MSVAGPSPQALQYIAEQEANRLAPQGITNILIYANMLIFVLPPGSGRWAAYDVALGKLVAPIGDFFGIDLLTLSTTAKTRSHF